MTISPRSWPARIQEQLERLYGIEAPSVDDFVRPQDDGREVVLVREADGELEIAVHLPAHAIAPVGEATLDGVCQVAEGVSHFLYLAERARRRLPATRLELEIQAEVDKFALLARLPEADGSPSRFDVTRAARLYERLFVHVSFLHEETTEHGERYRVANQVASRFAERLSSLAARGGAVVRALRDFHGAGQREKLEIVMAA